MLSVLNRRAKITLRSLAAPDLELVWLPVPVLGEGLIPPPDHGLTLAVVLLQPGSHGRISLASANPAEPPVIDPGYLTAESDLRGLVAGLRIAERLLRHHRATPLHSARP